MKSLLIALVVIGVVTAQGQPQFEVATVKLSQPVQPGALQRINLGTIRNGTVTLTNVTLTECIQFAYGIASKDQSLGRIGSDPAMCSSMLWRRFRPTLHRISFV
jgi:hypothetical protein